MKWNKFTLKTRSEVEDIVISTLADVGIEGVEIQDKQPLTESDKQQMFVDIMPDIPDDDGIAYLNFYLDVDEDKEKVLADVRAALAEMQEFLDLGECTITESETEDQQLETVFQTVLCGRHSDHPVLGGSKAGRPG